MARTKNKTTNPVLYWKPNQFPSARFSSVQWDSQPVGHAQSNNQDNAEESGNTEDNDRIAYLKNRFKQTDSEGTDCPSGPSGCCPG